MSSMKIDVYSHHFTVYTGETYFFSPTNQLMNEFLKRNVQWDYKKQGWGHDAKVTREIKAKFFVTDKDNKEYRIHINQLQSFLEHLNNHGYNDYTLLYHNPEQLNFQEVITSLKSHFTLRPLQVEAVDYCTSPNPILSTVPPWPYPAKLVELQTGEGKSIVSMETASRMKSRFVMVIRAQYLQKWYNDILEAMDISPEEIYMVQGGDALRDVLQLGVNNQLDNYKAIVVSNKTFQIYLRQFEEYGNEIDYPIMPYDFCTTLGAKVLLVDEGHQDFHLNYKIHLYTHTQLSVTTTATLVPDDPFLKKMARIVYPESLRFKPEDQEGFIQYRAFFYRFWNPKFIKTKNFKGYSHVEFEKSILKHAPTKRHYFAMLASIIENEYIRYIDENKVDKSQFKVIIFCSLIKMCTELTEFLQERFRALDIRRYVGEDPYENLIEPDIRVTTPGSAGTAVDIPGLYLGINTVAMGSSQQSKQTIGRLRRRKDGIQPVYYETYSLDIPVHEYFHGKKRSQFNDKVAFFNSFNYDKNI